MPDSTLPISRWSLGFFFALVAIPFVAVWTLTQGPRVLDEMMPVYEVQHVARVAITDNGLSLQDVVFGKKAACVPSGIMYLSISYGVEQQTEMLVAAERGDRGNVFVLRNGHLKPGDVISIPEIRFTLSKDVLASLGTGRLVIPCVRPFVGLTRAYTNPVGLR